MCWKKRRRKQEERLVIYKNLKSNFNSIWNRAEIRIRSESNFSNFANFSQYTNSFNMKEFSDFSKKNRKWSFLRFVTFAKNRLMQAIKLCKTWVVQDSWMTSSDALPTIAHIIMMDNCPWSSYNLTPQPRNERSSRSLAWWPLATNDMIQCYRMSLCHCDKIAGAPETTHDHWEPMLFHTVDEGLGSSPAHYNRKPALATSFARPLSRSKGWTPKQPSMTPIFYTFAPSALDAVPHPSSSVFSQTANPSPDFLGRIYAVAE